MAEKTEAEVRSEAAGRGTCDEAAGQTGGDYDDPAALAHEAGATIGPDGAAPTPSSPQELDDMLLAQARNKRERE